MQHRDLNALNPNHQKVNCTAGKINYGPTGFETVTNIRVCLLSLA